MGLRSPATRAKIALEYGTNYITMVPQVRTGWVSRGVGFLWIGLMVVGALLGGRKILQYLELVQLETEFVVALEQFRAELVQCERGLGALMVADTPTGRLAGYEPMSLRQSLHRHLHQAHLAYQHLQSHIETFLEEDDQPQLAWLSSRLQVEWAQLQASMEQFLQGTGTHPPNPALMRRFLGSFQSSPYRTLDSLKPAVVSRLHIQKQAVQREALLYGWLLGIGVLLGGVGFWWRWVLPAKRFQRSLKQLALPIPEAYSEWRYAQEAVEYLQMRLRRAEEFMRDLAMGRTPEPIPPESENDPLARSSRWLLQRFEQLREAERHRQAV